MILDDDGEEFLEHIAAFARSQKLTKKSEFTNPLYSPKKVQFSDSDSSLPYSDSQRARKSSSKSGESCDIDESHFVSTLKSDMNESSMSSSVSGISSLSDSTNDDGFPSGFPNNEATGSDIVHSINTLDLSDIRKVEIDNKMVQAYLENKNKANFKYFIGLFDHGGQEVFEVIHPFFMARLGFYAVVFKMTDMFDESKKGKRISNLKLWLNSIVMQTLAEKNGREKTASVVLVGTFRDELEKKYGEDSRELEDKLKEIDVILYEILKDSLVFRSNSLLIHENAIRTSHLRFFPVDNNKGRKDDTAKKLMKVIEKNFDESEYVCGNPKPVSWLQSYDHLKKLQRPEISYDAVVAICVKYGVLEEKVDEMLMLLNDMGMLWWNEEESLRDTAILDPQSVVDAFTNVICKFDPVEKEGNITRIRRIHTKAREAPEYSSDFSDLQQTGCATEKLMLFLLSEGNGKPTNISSGKILQMMKKYDLTFSYPESVENLSTSKIEKVTMYLIPALLKDRQLQGREESWRSSFYIHFTLKEKRKVNTALSWESMKSGFLPRSFFFHLVCKLINLPFNRPDEEVRLDDMLPDSCVAVLKYGNQRFKLTFMDDCIKVDIEGEYPRRVKDYLLVPQVDSALKSYMHKLHRTITLLFNSHLEEEKQCHIAFNDFEKYRGDEVKDIGALSKVTIYTDNKHPINGMDIKLQPQHHFWFEHLDRSDWYDLYLSYRWWGLFDDRLVDALYSELSKQVTDSNKLRRIRTFYDKKKLLKGELFPAEFAKALFNTKSVVVPFITRHGLQSLCVQYDDRIGDFHNPDVVDNVLVEWIFTMECKRRNPNLKVFPILCGGFELLGSNPVVISGVIGAYADDVNGEYMPQKDKVTFDVFKRNGVCSYKKKEDPNVRLEYEEVEEVENAKIKVKKQWVVRRKSVIGGIEAVIVKEEGGALALSGEPSEDTKHGTKAGVASKQGWGITNMAFVNVASLRLPEDISSESSWNVYDGSEFIKSPEVKLKLANDKEKRQAEYHIKDLFSETDVKGNKIEFYISDEIPRASIATVKLLLAQNGITSETDKSLDLRLNGYTVRDLFSSAESVRKGIGYRCWPNAGQEQKIF